MKQALKERGINADSLNAEKMHEILRNHEDFQNEKPKLLHFLKAEGHSGIFFPKFNPELNPIERVWAQSKQYILRHIVNIRYHRYVTFHLG